jgi:hypothetical protein
LNKLSDLHLKILEQSLISSLNPNLNKAEIVVFKYFEWRKEWLYYYTKESEYKKATKLIIYRKISENLEYALDPKTLNYISTK